MFFYEDDRKGDYKSFVKYENMNANKHWLTHYSNAKFLMFFAQNETDRNNRLRAQHELAIAQRKMEHWKRHPNWNLKLLTPEIELIDKQWRSK
jgi:hypothetical protein